MKDGESGKDDDEADQEPRSRKTHEGDGSPIASREVPGVVPRALARGQETQALGRSDELPTLIPAH